MPLMFGLRRCGRRELSVDPRATLFLRGELTAAGRKGDRLIEAGDSRCCHGNRGAAIARQHNLAVWQFEGERRRRRHLHCHPIRQARRQPRLILAKGDGNQVDILPLHVDQRAGEYESAFRAMRARGLGENLDRVHAKWHRATRFQPADESRCLFAYLVGNQLQARGADEMKLDRPRVAISRNDDWDRLVVPLWDRQSFDFSSQLRREGRVANGDAVRERVSAIADGIADDECVIASIRRGEFEGSFFAVLGVLAGASTRPFLSRSSSSRSAGELTAPGFAANEDALAPVEIQLEGVPYAGRSQNAAQCAGDDGPRRLQPAEGEVAIEEQERIADPRR